MCYCKKGCKIILVNSCPPTTKCYLKYLHDVWKLKSR